ncbi:MAG: thioredoxin [Peptoniphilaceae bacterium]|nr:thioredoxin [Peptoniphilaceae bacterium]MDY3738547.1 thioredoxin [Peptoniphilaceae bacterium]
MKEINSQEFKDKVVNGKGLSLVDFNATWCGPCQMQKPVLEDLDKESEFEIYGIDIDQNPNVAAAYNVQAVPTLMIFKDGTLKETMVGFQAASVLKETLERYK